MTTKDSDLKDQGDEGAVAPAMDDGQVIEILGRNLLIASLVSAGIEVATPLRDRGIDLIAYLDRDLERGFKGVPIQMKASSDIGFGVYEKYARIPGLLLVHVWHVIDPQRVELFAMTYPEARAIADAKGWPQKPSWQLHQGWRQPRPGPDFIAEHLERYRIGVGRAWPELIRQCAARAAAAAARE